MLLTKKKNQTSLAIDQVIGLCFNTSKSKYFYDTFSNEIFEVNKKFYDFLQIHTNSCKESRKERISAFIENWGKQTYQSIYTAIKDMTERGELFGPMPKQLCVPTESPEKRSQRHPETLCLSVTESCNLNCSYCSLSGVFMDERSRSNKFMKKEIAYAAIDGLLNNFPYRRRPKIDFFGGEPLLALDLILDCMAYARSKNKRCEFSMTTNGVLLTKDVFLKLKPYSPSLGISLDGPEKIHDQQRRTIGGCPTHKIIMSNLQTIYELDPNFFNKNIKPMAVVTNHKNIRDVARFFETNKIMKQVAQVSCAPVNQSGMASEFRSEESARMDELAIPARRKLKQAILSKDVSNSIVEWSLFRTPLLLVTKRQRKAIPRKWTFNHLCRPGRGQIKVSVDGDILVCEKSTCFPSLGSAHSGLDQEAISQMENDFLKMLGPCQTCWALRLCKICYRHLYTMESGKLCLSPASMQTACEDWKRRIKAAFVLHEEIREANGNLNSLPVVDDIPGSRLP